MLRVMTYVVFIDDFGFESVLLRFLRLINYFGMKLVLRDVYLKRFDSTNVFLFYTFLIAIWNKLCRCESQVEQ